MDYQKNYTGKRYGKPSEQNGAELFTEQSGYIPAQKRIENLLNAGQRLKDFRDQQFDFVDENSIDDQFFDPTRTKNFDLADATQLQYDLTGRQKRLQTAPEPLEEAKKPQTDPEPDKS